MELGRASIGTPRPNRSAFPLQKPGQKRVTSALSRAAQTRPFERRAQSRTSGNHRVRLKVSATGPMLSKLSRKALPGQLSVGVLGGGIGGLAAALALLRDGHDVRCFEQAAEFREVGAGVQIMPNASRLLLRMGLAEPMFKVGVRPPSVEFRRWKDGSLIASAPLGESSERRYGAPHFSIHRADLHQLLLSAVAALSSSAVRLAMRCTGITQGMDDVTVRFENGRQETMDVLIGADGIRSTARRMIAADEPRFGNMLAVRGVVPATRLPDWPAPIVLWPGPGRSVLAYRIGEGGSHLNFVGLIPSTVEAAESWTNRREPDEILRAFDGWDPTIQTILREAESVLVWPLYDRAPLESWGIGRVSLLGDAAHPMVPYGGQGAAQAIEDAYVLGRCLRGATREDAGGRLRSYEAIRMRRAAAVQASSTGRGGELHLPDGPEQEARDAAMVKPSGSDPNAWLYGYDAEKDGPWNE